MNPNSYWFEYDSKGNIVNRYLQQIAPTPATGNSLLGPFNQDTASTDVVTAYSFPNRYLAQGSPAALVLQPYLIVGMTEGTGTTGSGDNEYSVVTHTVTATIQGTPATPPTEATFNLFGATFTAPFTNGAATFTVSTHPSLNDPQVNLTVSATGCMPASVPFGSSVPTYALKAEVPSGESNPIIHPCGTGSRSVLSAYWTSTATNSAYTSADIATVVGVLLDAVFGQVIPQLVTAKTLTLDPNQENLANFMKSTILATVPSTMETAAPLPASGGQQTFDSHFGHYQSVQQATAKAMEQYGYDVQRFTDVL